MITESSTITLGLVITLGTILVGAILWLTSMRSNTKQNTKHIKSLETETERRFTHVEAKMDEQSKTINARMNKIEDLNGQVQISIARLEEKVEQIPEKIKVIINERK